MKQGIILVIFIFLCNTLPAQDIKRIACYHNTYDNSSGIIGITDTALYEYSWYSEAWLKFPSNGLNENSGQTMINEVAACENNSHNPSGIYVISDTSVHVYNYYSAYWYALPNTGLERTDGIVQLSDLTVRYDSIDDVVDVFVISGDHVYRYSRYLQSWSDLSNGGLNKLDQNSNPPYKMTISPNPLDKHGYLEFDLPHAGSKPVQLRLYTASGRFIQEHTIQPDKSGKGSIRLNTTKLTEGLYFYELKGSSFSHVRRFIKIE
jgi:hypothetical protein